MLLREVKTNRVFRIVTPEGAGYFTFLIDIDDNKWPIKKSNDDLRARLKTDAIDEIRLTVELNDPWSISERPPRPHYSSEKLDRDFRLIAPLLTPPTAFRIMLPGHRNAILIEHARANGTSRQRISRLLKRFWVRGMTRESLMDDMNRCGGPGKRKTFTTKKNGRRPRNGRNGVPRTNYLSSCLEIAADWLLADRKKRTLQGALDHIAKNFGDVRTVLDSRGRAITVGLERSAQPSIHQLKYHIETTRPYSVLRRAKLGIQGYDKTGREFYGRADQHVTGPGDSYLLDATIADIYLVSQFDRSLIVGRPTVYFAIDAFSRMIVGLYVGFEPPSWLAALLLLTNVVTPKVAFCAQFGIEISEAQWPCRHMSSTIFGDKAELMAIEGGRQLTQNLLIHVENAPSGRPDAKGIVELRFNTIPHQYRPFVPGYVEKDFGDRGARDYRLDATLNLHEFTAIMIWAIIQNIASPIRGFAPIPERIAQGYGSTPLEMWEYGIANRSGLLRATSIREIRRCVLPREKVPVTHYGIRFRNNYYRSPTAEKLDWLVKARAKIFYVTIAYDPRDLGLIWLCEGELFEDCLPAGTNSQDIVLTGMTLAEILDLRERNAKILDKDEDRAFQVRHKAKEETNRIIRAAITSKSKTMHEKGMKKLDVSIIASNKAMELETDRAGAAGVDSNLSIGPDSRRRKNRQAKSRKDKKELMTSNRVPPAADITPSMSKPPAEVTGERARILNILQTRTLK
jgi:hypothetical protein